MKTLEAKPFDQNVENWKRENRMFTSTVLEAGASGQNRIGTHALRSHRRSLIRFRSSNSCFLLETGIAGHERLSLAKWHPKAEKKQWKRPFFDTADRHEKLYGRWRLYASAQWRHETGGILSLFSSLSFDISIKNSAQRWSSDFQGLFRVKIRKMAQGSNDLSTLPLSRIFHIFEQCSKQKMPKELAELAKAKPSCHSPKSSDGSMVYPADSRLWCDQVQLAQVRKKIFQMQHSFQSSSAWCEVTMTESLQTLNHCPFLEWLVMERNLWFLLTSLFWREREGPQELHWSLFAFQ